MRAQPARHPGVRDVITADPAVGRDSVARMRAMADVGRDTVAATGNRPDDRAPGPGAES